MRIRGMTDRRGNIVVLMVLALPLMLAALALVIDIGRIALTRARLSAAADRAVYAGASSLAHSLGDIAAENWKINKAYRDLEHNFTSASQQDSDATKQRIDAYEAARDDAAAEIDSEAGKMPADAEQIAQATFLAVAPRAVAEINLEAEAEIDAQADPDDQWQTLQHATIAGASFVDPDSVDGGSYAALKYLKKRRSPAALIGISAQEEVAPLMLRAALGESIVVYADSAAQAFGGSIEDFALSGGDTLDEAESFVTDDGYDALYRAAIVPNWVDE